LTRDEVVIPDKCPEKAKHLRRRQQAGCMVGEVLVLATMSLIFLHYAQQCCGNPMRFGSAPVTKGRIKYDEGCQDNQLSGDTGANGVFTNAVKRVWNNGHFNGSYRSFHRQIRNTMPLHQQPNFFD
jgi:hypothetical protein